MFLTQYFSLGRRPNFLCELHGMPAEEYARRRPDSQRPEIEPGIPVRAGDRSYHYADMNALK